MVDDLGVVDWVLVIVYGVDVGVVDVGVVDFDEYVVCVEFVLFDCGCNEWFGGRGGGVGVDGEYGFLDVVG